MNATEMQYALKLAAQLEADAAELYAAFAANSPVHSRERQFWQLLSYEEKTHSQVMELIAVRLDADFWISQDETPKALCHDLQGLREFQSWVRTCTQSVARLGNDQSWMARVASDLETSESDKVLDWLMHLPVPEQTRELVLELIRGTTDHARRVSEFARAHSSDPVDAAQV